MYGEVLELSNLVNYARETLTFHVGVIGSAGYVFWIVFTFLAFGKNVESSTEFFKLLVGNEAPLGGGPFAVELVLAVWGLFMLARLNLSAQQAAQIK
jgi:hypothetical protein